MQGQRRQRRFRISCAVVAVVLLGSCPGGYGRTPSTTRFSAVSFTAISDDEYWLLGRIACGTRGCYSVLRTTDGGRSFTRRTAPRLATEGVVPILRFATRRDGFAFVPGIGGVFYATHDGAATWRRVRLGSVLAFATGGGYAYTVTARCAEHRCGAYRFARSPVSTDAWRTTAPPFTPDGIVDLSAHGTRLWLLGTRAGAVTSARDVLARSSNGGRSFVTGRGPCVPDLGGTLSPVSARVVWAVCPTGLSAAAWRSTDGGVTFTHVRTPPLVNSAALAPASRDTAVLARNGARSRLLRTTDGGGHWRAPSTPGAPIFVPWMGFTDARVGAALVQTHYDASLKAEAQALWRTTDGGAHWSTIAVR